MPITPHPTLTRLVTLHTTNVCQTMLGLEIAPWSPAGTSEESAQTSVVALIGITGPWNGTGTLSCPAPLALALSGRFLMTTFEAVDAEVLDAMGELANMVIGNVKEDLAQEFGALAISTPTVIYGGGLYTRGVRGETSTAVRFDCGSSTGVLDVPGTLDVAMSLVPSADARRGDDPVAAAIAQSRG